MGLPDVLTIKRAATLLGVSEVTLRRWDKAGKFSPHRHPLNGYRCYRRTEVLRLRAQIYREGDINISSRSGNGASGDEANPHERLPVVDRDARLRRALIRALQHPNEQETTDVVVGALATLIEDHEGATAFDMAQTGIYGFIRREAHDMSAARRWHAVAAGCAPGQDPIGIVDLANEVHRTAFLYKASPQWISPAGAAAVKAFRAQFLVQRFGEHVPSDALLLDWFSKHDPRPKRGLKTSGIVARIMLHARLLGAHGQSLRKTVTRVDRYLKRARTPTG